MGAPHPSPRLSTQCPNAHWELASAIPVLTAFPRAEGLRDPKGGEVCRAFKVIPRSSCLTHRGAMLLCGELHRLPSLTLPRILLSPGSHRRAPASTVGFGSRSFLWQKESIQANTNHSERFQRRGSRRVSEGILQTRFCEDPWAPRLQRQSITS